MYLYNENGVVQHDIVKFKNREIALAGVAQWIECPPTNQKVASLISSQDSCLGCGPGPQ